MPSDLRVPGAALTGLFLAAAGATPAAGQEGPWALTNVRIETVTRGVIERGTVVIRDGVIAAAGANVAVPADARVLDLAGRTVSPGLIDLTSSLGLPSLPAGGGGGPGGGGGGGGFGGGGLGAEGVRPDRMAADQVTIPVSDARSAREAGFTAALVAPPRGLFRGRSALMPLRDSAMGPHAIRPVVGQHMGYQGVGGGAYPGSLLGVIATQRQMLYDAQHYARVSDRWRTNPRGLTRPERDPALEGLVPVVRGEEPLFVDASNENEIRRAARLATELGVRLTVVGATEAWRALDALRGHGVVVSVNYPQPTQVTGWRFRGSLQQTPGDSAAAVEAARRAVEGNAAALHAAGIRFALAPGGGRPGEYLANVRKAVAAGLPAQVALEAMTIRAAEAAGAGDLLGSIEVGKIANLVVTTEPLLAENTRIVGVFVDGTWYEGPRVTAAAARGAGGGGGAARAGGPQQPAGEGGPVSVAGTWTIVTNSPQGSLESTFTVAQDGQNFTGTMVSQMGSTQVTDGQIRGRRAVWTVTLSFGGQGFTLGYDAEVTGNRMNGTVAAGDFGSFTFTGERRP
jgi:hypothetical protein